MAATGQGWRNTLTARLLIGGLVITIGLVATVSGFLLVSRALQTDQAVQSEATNRSATGYQLLVHVTEPQTQYAATTLARAASLQKALALSDAGSRAAAVATVFNSGLGGTSSPGSRLAVLDRAGTLMYTDECGAGVALSACESNGTAHLADNTPSISLAIAEGRRAACATAATASHKTTQCPAGYEGVELIGNTLPAFDAAVDVRDSAHQFLGVVAYSTTLQAQFARFGSALLYTPSLITTGSSSRLFRFDPNNSYALTQVAIDPRWTPPLAQHPTSFNAEYTAVGTGSVASSYIALTAPDGSIPGYLAVEVPTAVFAGQTGADERTILLIGVTAIVLVFLIIAGFASRFVVRPIARLERGVRRIAGGDLSSDIPVTGDDELGRLAKSVNQMRAQIAGYIGHLDSSIGRLESVSHALTATGEGVEALHTSVLAAAAAIGGGQARAALFTIDDGSLGAAAGASQSALAAFGTEEVGRLARGEHVRRPADDNSPGLLAVPMMYHAEVVGALAVWSFDALSDSDERALAALANNASVATENTRLFEQERETVQRLRDLDVAKTNFLTTTQHELRTPVLAIKGEIELITAAWQQLDEATKLELVRDMEISARLLGDIVENIVVFSLLNSEAVTLRTEHVDVAAAINATAAQVRENFKDGLPVELTLTLTPATFIVADRERFEQVMRALLDNAVKFTPAGGQVKVVTRRTDSHCRIDVVDDGIGID
ncbi:MAG TPA: HAMP domain-containing protein, partial [Candidatus Deferrimicrobium sp.]|nr:HAMP domain-containing protein [Candidatus Deferrimicrobium sp.]